MTEGRFEFSTGVIIDTADPERLSGPQECEKCNLYYYRDHFCTEKDPIILQSYKGHYDG